MDIATEVKRDIDRRVIVGLEHYGKKLTPNNGRDALLDAYEEALDLCMYLKQALIERDSENKNKCELWQE